MPKLPLTMLAALLLAAAAAAPACTRVRPQPAPSTPVLTAASAAADEPASTFSDPPATPTPTPLPDDDGRPGRPTPPAIVATPRATLPPASRPPVAQAPRPSPGVATPSPAPSASATPPTAGPRRTVVEVVAARAELSVLTSALAAAGLDDSLGDGGPFTLFAPTDAAFAAQPVGTLDALLRPENKGRLTQILGYHVVPGSYDSRRLRDGTLKTLEGQLITIDVGVDGVLAGGARVVEADVRASNGLVHLIDKLLSPPDLAAEAANLTLLVAKQPDLLTADVLLELAGLDDTLVGPGPFTLFAPTDAAWELLPAGTVQRLQAPGNQAKLAELLRYHVVAGKVTAAQLKDGGLATLHGAGLGVVVTGQPAPRVGGGSVRLADVFAGNGVLHLIDRVAIPPGYVFP